MLEREEPGIGSGSQAWTARSTSSVGEERGERPNARVGSRFLGGALRASSRLTARCTARAAPRPVRGLVDPRIDRPDLDNICRQWFDQRQGVVGVDSVYRLDRLT
jgi:hypothetical protein